MCNLAWSLRTPDDAQCDCLLKIARLRNHFAHKLIATFDEDRVKGWISEAHRAFFDARIPGGTQEDTSFRKTAFMFSFALDFELFHRWIDVIYHTESYSELMPSYLKEYSEKPDLSEI